LVTVFEELVATDNGQITCVLVASTDDDGKHIVFTGDTTSIVNVWSLRTEPRRDKRRPPHATVALLNRLYGHFDRICCLAYSAEYRVIVSGSADASVIVWDANSLQMIHRLEGHTSPIRCVAINSSTGDIIAAAGVTLSAWTLNGELLAWICCGQSLITNSITALAVSRIKDWQPQSHCSVITGHRDGSLRFWALQIPNGRDEVQTNQHIFSQNQDKKKKKSEMKKEKQLEKYFAPKLPTYQLRRMKYETIDEIERNAIVKDNDDIKETTTSKQLAADTTLRFKQKHCRKKHASQVTAIHTSHSTDQYLWSASANGQILEWSLHRTDDHWLKDSDVQNCPKCQSQFGVLERRHHCRKCGNIYCHKCSNNKVDLPDMGYSEPVRVCDFCWERITKMTEQQTTTTTTADDKKKGFKFKK